MSTVKIGCGSAGTSRYRSLPRCPRWWSLDVPPHHPALAHPPVRIADIASGMRVADREVLDRSQPAKPPAAASDATSAAPHRAEAPIDGTHAALSRGDDPRTLCACRSEERR